MAKRDSHIIDTVLNTLKQDSMTNLEGMVLCGTTRLAAHVEKLRKKGYLIRSENFVTKQGIRLARYKRVKYQMQGDARPYCTPDNEGNYKPIPQDTLFTRLA
jgi:hypothetical protein